MKVAIIGSREFPEQQGRRAIRALLRSLHANVSVVSGGARGPDTWAEEEAFLLGIPVEVFRADWYPVERLGEFDKGAGFKRNRQIIDAADYVVALWDTTSRGTAHSIELAQRAGKPVLVLTPV